MDSPTQEKQTIEVEQNLSIMAKKFLHMVKVVYFMLRKGICKGKLLMDLKLMMMKKNNKLSGHKAIHNLMLHSHNTNHKLASAFSAITSAAHRRHHQDKKQDFITPPNEYEFSCSNTPAHHTTYNPSTFFHLPFHLNKRKKENNVVVDDDEFAVHAIIKALEMINSGASSPALPGFGKSPMVRQLRITDSPFPIRDADEDGYVDAAAEEFIEKFYKDLRRQNAMAE